MHERDFWAGYGMVVKKAGEIIGPDMIDCFQHQFRCKIKIENEKNNTSKW